MAIDLTVFDGLSLKDLVEKMAELKGKLEEAKQLKTDFQIAYDHLRHNKIPEALDEEGLSNATFDGIGRVALTSDIYSSIPKEREQDAWEWLRDNGHGGIIVEYIHSGTLKATLKAILKKGEKLPEDLFKVTAYSRATITKVR